MGGGPRGGLKTFMVELVVYMDLCDLRSRRIWKSAGCCSVTGMFFDGNCLVLSWLPKCKTNKKVWFMGRINLNTAKCGD